MKNPIAERQKVYKLTFENEAGKEVLSDLRVFCHATKTTFSKEPLEMARLEGRREVFMQIMNLLKIDYSDYYNFDIEEEL